MDGYEINVPAAKPRGPLCRGERRKQAQLDHVCLKEFLNAWPYKFLGSLVPREITQVSILPIAAQTP